MLRLYTLMLALSGSFAGAMTTINRGDVNHKYIGCYNETDGYTSNGGARALGNGNHTSDPLMSVEKCWSFCAPWKYAGVEYSRECWCSTDIQAIAETVDESECDTPCAGNNTEFCGAAQRILVYQKIGAGSRLLVDSAYMIWILVVMGIILV